MSSFAATPSAQIPASPPVGDVLPTACDRKDGILHRTVASAWPSLQSAAVERGGSWPYFVQQEFERYLRCGCLEHGFLRVYCRHCRLDRLVPFSCKGRGFCPSCGARRMAAAAAHLTDHVIPRVPTRQWVLSLPFDLRYRLAFDRVLSGQVRGLFARAVIGHLRRQMSRRADAPDKPRWDGGAATWTQRFGDGLRLNVHFHAVVLDGVFEHGDGRRPHFWPASEPTAEELAAITGKVTEGLRRLLAADVEGERPLPAYLTDDPTLATCLFAASQGRCALSGARSSRLACLKTDVTPHATCAAKEASFVAGGFNLHAGPRIDANDRRRLERLCRYAARPALSEARLGRHDDGRIIFDLKRTWSDGTTSLLLTPLELVERLALMVPPPRAHLVTYHGVLSSHSRLRPQVAPDLCGATSCREEVPDSKSGASVGHSPPPQKASRQRAVMDWAALLRRTFAADVLRCPRCGHRSEVIAAICDGRVIAAILAAWKPISKPP